MRKVFDNYVIPFEIDSNGNVWSLNYRRTGKKQLLKLRKCNSGYYNFSVREKNEKKQKNLWVHRLVAEAFIPNPYNKREVNHINGNKLDNRIENLEWVSSSENRKHAYMIGLFKDRKGENSPNCKIKKDKRDIVFEMRSQGYLQREIAEYTKIGRSTVSKILSNKQFLYQIKKPS